MTTIISSGYVFIPSIVSILVSGGPVEYKNNNYYLGIILLAIKYTNLNCH